MKIITGMHRSGTSLVAKLFFEAGAAMGNPETFHPSDRWNPGGYYEHQEILSINMQLIHGPFGRMAYFRLPSENTILKRAGKLKADLGRLAGKYGELTIKETRFSLTLPAWLAAGASVERLLVCLRPPWEVAASLSKRNRIGKKLGTSLWLTHNQRLLDHAAGLPLRFVSYRRLLDRGTFAEEISGALRFMGLAAEEELVRRLADEVVKPGMNHHSGVPEQLEGKAGALWEKLCAMHERQLEEPAVQGASHG